MPNLGVQLRIRLQLQRDPKRLAERVPNRQVGDQLIRQCRLASYTAVGLRILHTAAARQHWPNREGLEDERLLMIRRRMGKAFGREATAGGVHGHGTGGAALERGRGN
jgi:hypothetical protein